MHNLSYENQFYLHVKETTHFHIKSHAPTITLKKRHKITRNMSSNFSWTIAFILHTREVKGAMSCYFNSISLKS